MTTITCKHYVYHCLQNHTRINSGAASSIVSLQTFNSNPLKALIMFQTASIVILVCGILVEIFAIQERYWFGQLVIPAQLSILAFRGLMFLVYPLLGHIADVCLNRYRTIKWSFAHVIGGKIVVLISIIIGIVIMVTTGWNLSLYPYSLLIIIPFFGVLLSIVGVGLYESNIIQFGLDQLLEAPTSKLIVFIHWFYWAQNIGSLISFYIFSGLDMSSNYIIPNYDLTQKVLKLLAISLFTIGLVVCKDGITLFLLLLKKKYFYIERAGLNPFKSIHKVLKYSWKHKVPEHRSAFTYWEEDIPRRIDLGKNKYGGPFTNEEVEDTKTFLRIILLLLCLFGYQLAGDGYSAPLQLQRTSCPSLPVLLLIVVNPLHMSTLVAVVAIPLYRLVIKKIRPDYRGILLLTRMWMGLFLCLVQVTIYINIVLNHDTTYWQQHHSKLPLVKETSHYSPTSICFIIRTQTRNFSLANDTDLVDNSYLWFIIPQLLNGFSSLFVSMTAFEFICAQAPRTTQGLLIGLWYATFSIRYLVVGILDNLIIERRSWLICEGVKWFLILVSLVLFSCVSRRYRYRQRDEIVNVQGMIEDTHEKWLDQEEEHMRKLLLQPSN